MLADSKHISKTLFMDLAFLLIAGLVLLVKEPVEEAAKQQKAASESLQEQIARLEVTPHAADKIVIDDTSGESLFLRLSRNGSLEEVRIDGLRERISNLNRRVAEMSTPALGRVIVLMVEPGTEYQRYWNIRAMLRDLELQEAIQRFVECPLDGGMP